MCLLFCERSDIVLQRCSEIFKHLTELVTSWFSLCFMEQKICYYIHTLLPPDTGNNDMYLLGSVFKIKLLMLQVFYKVILKLWGH